MKTINVLGGGTFSEVRCHLDLAVRAFGETAIYLTAQFQEAIPSDSIAKPLKPEDQYCVYEYLTKMAEPRYSDIVTNQDVEKLVDALLADPDTKIIVFNVAMCDFTGSIDNVPGGKYATRLKTRDGVAQIDLEPAPKVISKIRKERKDIFLVAFKTTCGATEDEQYIAGLNLLKENSCNLVLANDVETRTNMIIVPEEARYYVSQDRKYVLDMLVDMTMSRSKLTFTRSEVIPSPLIDWADDQVPASLRTVVDYCRYKGAYKPFRGKTAGHFAAKVDSETFLTSVRSTNFNDLDQFGLVKIKSTGRDNVTAYGAKPSVGGMSQRIIFTEHPDTDCIVHFHCPLKSDAPDLIHTTPQEPYECGSHECGENTSRNLAESITGIKAVYLEEHGPNIVFHHSINPYEVIRFIERNFDLSQKTGGPVELT